LTCDVAAYQWGVVAEQLGHGGTGITEKHLRSPCAELRRRHHPCAFPSARYRW
jgi:hypothetical protein